jgi:hypothetical protein
LFRYEDFFEDIEWKRLNLIKWQFIHINDIIFANSNLFLFECLQKLCVDLNIIQQEFDFDYQESNYLRKNLIRACRNYETLMIELHNSSLNLSNLINSFYNSIINYESIIKSRHTYFQDIDIDDWTHDHNFTNRQYRRRSFSNHDNRKLLIDFCSRDKFSIRALKKCFVCDKINSWLTNHTEKEIDDSKKRFANRNLKWKSRQEFQRRLKQFITKWKENQEDDFIAQFFEKLKIDIDVSLDNALFDNVSSNKFVIELDSESESFLIFVDSLNDLKTIITIINMLVHKTFKHKLISMNNITAFLVSISYTYNVFISSRYDDHEFKSILIDHDATDLFSKDIEQFTILQRISKIILNKNNRVSFKFEIDEILFIDTINLNISVDMITFHIVLVQISFLSCLVDINRLRLHFNNLINMLIEERSINKVRFRKELYFTHSN